MRNENRYYSINYGQLLKPAKHHYDLAPGGMVSRSHHGYERVAVFKPESPYGVMPSVSSHLPVHLQKKVPIADVIGGDYGVPNIFPLRENQYGVVIPISIPLQQPVVVKLTQEMLKPSQPNPEQATPFKAKPAQPNFALREKNIYGVAIPLAQPVKKTDEIIYSSLPAAEPAEVKPRIPKRVLSPDEIQHKHINTVKENLQQFHDGLKKEKGTAAMMPALREQLKNILKDVGRLRGVLNQEKFTSAKNSIGRTLASTHAKMREMEKNLAASEKAVAPQQTQPRTRPAK